MKPELWFCSFESVVRISERAALKWHSEGKQIYKKNSKAEKLSLVVQPKFMKQIKETFLYPLQTPLLSYRKYF